MFIYPYQILFLGTGTLRNCIPLKFCGIKQTLIFPCIFFQDDTLPRWLWVSVPYFLLIRYCLWFCRLLISHPDNIFYSEKTLIIKAFRTQYVAVASADCILLKFYNVRKIYKDPFTVWLWGAQVRSHCLSSWQQSNKTVWEPGQCHFLHFAEKDDEMQ